MYPQGVCRIHKPFALATTALSFKFFKLHSRGKRSAVQMPTIIQRFPRTPEPTHPAEETYRLGFSDTDSFTNESVLHWRTVV